VRRLWRRSLERERCLRRSLESSRLLSLSLSRERSRFLSFSPSLSLSRERSRRLALSLSLDRSRLRSLDLSRLRSRDVSRRLSRDRSRCLSLERSRLLSLDLSRLLSLERSRLLSLDLSRVFSERSRLLSLDLSRVLFRERSRLPSLDLSRCLSLEWSRSRLLSRDGARDSRYGSGEGLRYGSGEASRLRTLVFGAASTEASCELDGFGRGRPSSSRSFTGSVVFFGAIAHRPRGGEWVSTLLAGPFPPLSGPQGRPFGGLCAGAPPRAICLVRATRALYGDSSRSSLLESDMGSATSATQE
jgi:hypothetical protein